MAALEAVKKTSGGQAVVPRKRKRTRARKKSGQSQASTSRGMREGTMVVSRRDLLASSKNSATNGTCSVYNVIADANHFPYLKRLAAAFQRVRWRRLALTWHATSGTTKDGAIIMAFDSSWSVDAAQPAKSDRATVASLTPIIDFPGWSPNRKLVVPANLLKGSVGTGMFVIGDTVKDLAGPGQFVVHNIGSCTGEIWVEYEVEFLGTKPA